MYSDIVSFIRSLYPGKPVIGLHEPRFGGNEKAYLNECIDTTFVSSVGAFVDRFEQMVAHYTGSRYAIATVNGTAALHIALKLAGVDETCDVVTQPLTFAATCNAIAYCGADPVFVDVDKETMGMSPESLRRFLERHGEQRDGHTYNRHSGQRIGAVVPMHTFGHPCRIGEIAAVCDEFRIPLVEDAAESLGSFVGEKHTGTFGNIGVFSFNGNKTITTGGGGMIVTNDEALAKRAKHLTTTAKIPHPYEYAHDEIGYNYRLPNLNAALGCAQMEQLDGFIENKRRTALRYRDFFRGIGIGFMEEPSGVRSNYWLNALILKNLEERNAMLKKLNDNGILARPIWQLMNRQIMFKHCLAFETANAEWLEERVVNIPSGVTG